MIRSNQKQKKAGQELAKKKYALQNIFEFLDAKVRFTKIRLVSKKFDAAVFEIQSFHFSRETQLMNSLSLKI